MANLLHSYPSSSQNVDTGGYKSWMVGHIDYNSTVSRYGGWDDLNKRNEIPSNENVLTKQQFNEKPLLLRRLVAAFPFLSSWTKLLF
ncbi:BnaA05g33090D [Brassica napus]|uniref:(rape) hypothetical protein n=1 Tax=Brassica napus TaxID=3708 RepID=A0A078IHA2_BRANA|nr:unnamed protein product [Brassica napus]CDY49347.1 BnaA05g33090D [Brassica napus]